MPTLPMSLTTLCYLEKDDSYLMMHRVKKKNDVNLNWKKIYVD